MKIKSLKLKTAWQFNPQDNTGQPDYVHVQTALGGPRAVVRPPVVKPSVPDVVPVILHLAPTDWLIELENGAMFQMNAHAAMYLLEPRL